ncbi:FtsX-like permease family protein [Clostridium estertheticum]|uniref:FtsX-like permease family protein n=1 Tax=Clostridium estertheticum TaxID=238834 RepID=UPI001C6EF3DD|nr:FtsX-like permease family protein [Clostridium estertheticum]MBW9153917.1 FtsX-like permease family protein [Clostridium estertheticum]WLC86531.1 FtsX-like permease family protein [Clostridium estertheticum]
MEGFLQNENSTRVIGIFGKIDTDSSTAVTMGSVIIIIIAFLFYFITKSTIMKECSAIGTLYAQGYTAKEIRRHYIKIPVLLTLIGTVTGYILGSTLVMHPLIQSSYSFYCIPNIKLINNLAQIICTIVLPTLIVFAINEIGLIRLLNAEPLQLMRKDLKRGREKKIQLPYFSF